MISPANLPPQWSGNKKRLAQPVHLLRDSSPYFISRSMLPSRMHGPFLGFCLKPPLSGTASRASVATLRQKKLAPFHFCLAKNSYPLPPFSFSSQTRFTGLCSEPHMLGTNCPEEFGCVTGANAPVPCFCHLPHFQADGQCLL